MSKIEVSSNAINSCIKWQGDRRPQGFDIVVEQTGETRKKNVAQTFRMLNSWEQQVCTGSCIFCASNKNRTEEFSRQLLGIFCNQRARLRFDTLNLFDIAGTDLQP